LANQCDDFAGIVERFEQGNRIFTLGQVPHWTVAAGIKNSVEVFRFHVGKELGVGKNLLSGFVLLKAFLRFRLISRYVALWVDRRLSAFRRCEGYFDTGVFERKVGGGEFFKPDACFASGASKLVVGGEYH
jgi:hypothetical protein